MVNETMWQKIKNIENKEQILFWLGLIVMVAATTIETLRGRASNYYVYSDATNMFWHGLTPYTQQFITDHGRYFLYTPVFTTLFAPILLLPKWLARYRSKTVIRMPATNWRLPVNWEWQVPLL